MSEFQHYQGGLLEHNFTSYRGDVQVIPAAFGDFPRTKWGDSYEFTDGHLVFTLYTPQGFSEDPETLTNWDSRHPSHLRIGATMGAPAAVVARFKEWIEALSNTYKATHAQNREA